MQDLVNLAPRKPDWDLKRDVAKKLEKLERRTQRAIAELISKDQCNLINEPVHEKTNNLGFRPGLTQTGLYSHRRWSEA